MANGTAMRRRYGLFTISLMSSRQKTAMKNPWKSRTSGARFQPEIERDVAGDCERGDRKQQPCCAPARYDSSVLMPDEDAEEEHNGCVDQHIPRVKCLHRAETDGSKDADHPPCGIGEHPPPPVRVRENEDKEDLIEDTDNMGMDIPPDEGEEG